MLLFRIEFRVDETDNTGTLRMVVLAPETEETADSPSRFDLPYSWSGFVCESVSYGGEVPSKT